MRIIIGLVILSLSACAKISYVNKEGEKFSYTRIGSMKLQGLDINLQEKGDKMLKLESSQGKAGDLAETLLNLSEVAKKVTLTP